MCSGIMASLCPTAAEVTVFIPPYMPTAEDVAIAVRMPRLRVVQALMAGVDGILRTCPPLRCGARSGCMTPARPSSRWA